MTPYEAMAVFAIFEQADDYDSIMWRVDTRPGMDRSVKIFAQCSDFFYWATADCEEITKEDVSLLEQALADLKAVDAEYELPRLFAARKRKLRPQKPYYKDMEPPVAALFDACCTEAERTAADEKDANWWRAFAHKISAEKQ
jgi:hypothetical protein